MIWNFSISYCGSIHVYSVSLVWLHTKQCHQLQVAYNNVFRKFPCYDKYCSASGMFTKNRVDGYDARELVYGFRGRLQISNNPLTDTIVFFASISDTTLHVDILFNAYLIATSEWNAGNVHLTNWHSFWFFLIFVYISCARYIARPPAIHCIW